MSRPGWTTRLLELYVPYSRERGQAPPMRVTPFDRNLIIRFALVQQSRNHELDGMATMTTRLNSFGTRHIGTLEDVYVLPKYRGHGFGTQLMIAVVTEARKRQLIRLEVALDLSQAGSVPMRHICAKLGFQCEDVQQQKTARYALAF